MARRRRFERVGTHVAWMRIASIVFAITAIPVLLDRPGVLAAPLIGVSSLALVYSLLAYLAHKRSWGAAETRALVTSTLDAVLVLAVLGVTGGFASPFTPVLYVSMAAVAYQFELVPSLAFAAVYAFGYVGLTMLVPAGMVAPMDLVLRTGFLVATGTLAALHSEAYQKVEVDRAQAQQTYERVLETVPGIVTALGPSGTIHYSNRGESLTGEAPLVGTSVDDWLDGEALETVQTALDRVFETGDTVEFQVPVPTGSDGQAFYQNVAGPLREDGEVVAAVVASIDVTRRVEAQRRLRDQARALQQSNEALARYARLTAHDLREPLRDIVRYLQRIDRREGDDLSDESRGEMEFVVKRAHRLDDLVRALHTFAEVDERVFEVSEVDLEAAVDQAILRLDPSPPPRVTLRTGDLATVTADREAIVGVLYRLMENAHDHADADHVEVVVESREIEDGWEVAVEDDGPGIPARYHDRIFEPFERLQTSGERSHPGMGLATARRLVERMGGEIRVESEAGEGTRFTFTVPERALLVDADDATVDADSLRS